METNHWDQDYQGLAQQIKVLEDSYFSNSDPFLAELSRKNRLLASCDLTLRKISTRFHRMSQVTHSIRRKLQALISWTNEVSQQIISLVSEYDSYLKLFMWLRLFKIRFLGDWQQQDSYLLSDLELEQVVEKFSSLRKMEAFLHRKHFQLMQQEKSLRKTFDCLQTEEANFDAGTSMQQQWGKGLVSSQRHPTLHELEKLFYSIGFSTESRVKESYQLKMLSTDLYSKSQRLMDQCRSLMEHNDRLKRPSFNHLELEKVEHSLNQIRLLEKKVVRVADSALPHLKGQLPILLKKKPIRVTTMPGKRTNLK